MCGLSGFILARTVMPADELVALASRMAETLRHRGPDDAGVWADAESGVALGHRRLSIIDLSAHGHQPMQSASGRYVIAYNGEVYNFAELKRDLDRFGVAWHGHSDTEVLLEAIEHWGLMPAVRRMVGMFAFALWDREEQALWLVRDRLGVKPLYYGWVGGNLVFASELRTFQAFPGFAAEIDPTVLSLFLRHSCVPGSRAIYRGVHKLPPGQLLRFDARRPNGTLREETRGECYWSVQTALAGAHRDPFRGDVGEAADRLDALLREAVALRMVADVPVGTFLSGGLDSSLVTALMQAQSSRPVRTFTIASSDRRYDESAHAAAVAAHLGTEHRVLMVTEAEALAAVPDLAAIYDEPFGDSSQLPTLLVSRLTRRDVTVALSGDGGDEVFGGYNRYVWGPRLWQTLRRFPVGLRASAGRALLGRGRWLARGVKYLPSRMQIRLPDDKIKKMAEIMPSRSYREFYQRLVTWRAADELRVEGAEEFSSPWVRQEQWASAEASWVQMMCADLQGYLPDDILVKVDRASMSVGLEVREPLLDHRVVEFALSLPEAYRLRDGRGKWLLHQVANRYLPPGLMDRPKMGFAIPLAQWLRGALRGWAEELLAPQELTASGMAADQIGRLWHEHLAGQADHGGVLWNILMFQAWRQHMEKGYPARRRS